MASPSLEAKDSRVMELAPYLPRRNVSRRGSHGTTSRLRGPVVKTAQTWPAGNAVSYKVSNEWMLASWPYDAAAPA